MSAVQPADTWHPTACILCSRNCGLEVRTEDGRITSVRGDKKHPLSQGYLCQKAARLDFYQNHADRLTAPLRRKADGTYEEIPWDTAFREIAEKIVAIRTAHGGRALAYYGGGGQGNHLGGVYGRGLVEAMGTRFHYSALAQEKTGDFWVNGKLFGRQTCHVAEAVEEAEVVVFIGTNPWQAHGIRNARDTVRAIAKDPKRTMIVIDPKRTETAELADIHLRVRPGTDAFLLTALLAAIAQEERENMAYLSKRTRGYEKLREALLDVPVADYAARAGVPEEDVRRVARTIAGAKSAAVRIDLGLQQSLHSTLNSYLEKVLTIVTGHFGEPGGNALHSFIMPLIGHSDDVGPGSKSWKTTVTGMPEIGKLFPPNVLPAEIDNDDPGRVRALVVDSANPALSGADTAAWTAAFAKLELMVVVDVAMTETARHAHYILPAATQFEKWETTFFTMEFPTQMLHLRRPLFAQAANTLPEPEIYRRLLVAMGELPARGFPFLRAVARFDRRYPRLRLFPAAFGALMRRNRKLRPYAAFVLYDTLGRALPDGAAAVAPLWGAAHLYAKKHPDAVRKIRLSSRGADLGEELFARLLENRSGATISTHTYDDARGFIRHADGLIHLDVPEMLTEIMALADEAPPTSADYPLVLIAGERRSYNANTIYRNPAWRKKDGDGALHIHPEDAAKYGLADGASATCTSSRGSVPVRVAVTDATLPGVVTLPHGYGMDYPNGGGRVVTGPILNLLTDAAHCDPITATPYHKFVPVRVMAGETA
ncbi:MAG: molybdopterin-dependent oxidoreductase [Deltaproteobacteria bacterium]|nr:molybdopterin-dependent oxidoreductase [Deltaproteobacteria bacterium]